jgi:chloride channel 3/4/5
MCTWLEQSTDDPGCRTMLGPIGGSHLAGESSTSHARYEVDHESNDDDEPLMNDAGQGGAQNKDLGGYQTGDLGIKPPPGISFKRKSKHKQGFSLSNLLQVPLKDYNERTSPPVTSTPGRARELREQSSRNAFNVSPGRLQTAGTGKWAGTKEENPLDWYVEGPGRRVGYEDSSTIDWIFEYTKERQRLRVLYTNTPGLIGYVRQLLDASHIWLVLIATGISVGVLAASIDIVSLWLGDMKGGICRNGVEGGRFYLHRRFCCWGHDDLSLCQDWITWRDALHIPSRGGAYTVEYMFFVLFSVRLSPGCLATIY